MLINVNHVIIYLVNSVYLIVPIIKKIFALLVEMTLKIIKILMNNKIKDCILFFLLIVLYK